MNRKLILLFFLKFLCIHITFSVNPFEKRQIPIEKIDFGLVVFQSLKNRFDNFKDFFRKNWMSIGIFTVFAGIYIAKKRYEPKKKPEKRKKNLTPIKLSSAIIKILNANQINNIYDKEARPFDLIKIDFKPIQFEEDELENEENEDDEDFKEIILSMSSLSELQSIIITYYNMKINKKLDLINFFTIKLFLSLIDIIEQKIDKKIKELDKKNIKNENLISLIQGLKNNFYYFRIQKDLLRPLSNFKNGKTNPKYEIKINEEISIPEDEKEAKERSFISFLERFKENSITKGPIYKIFKFDKDNKDPRYLSLDTMYKNYFNNKIKTKLPARDKIIEIIKIINKNLDQWKDNLPLQRRLQQHRKRIEPLYIPHDRYLPLQETGEF